MNELRKPSAKRFLAWLLAIVLCVGAIPGDEVFAEPKAAENTQAQSENARQETAMPEDAQPEDGQTEYRVTFMFSAADGFAYLGEAGGQTVISVKEGESVTGIQEEYSNGTRTILGWQDAETRERVYLSQPVTRNMVLHPILDKYHAWFNCYDLGYGNLQDVPAGTPLSDLVPELEEKDHYTFEYWYSGVSENEAFDFDGKKADRDYYFYGKVSRDFAYEVKFHAGSEFEEVETQYLKEGEKPFEPTGLDNGNRKIVGWTTEEGSGEKYDFTQAVTDNLNLYPIFDKYRLYFDGTNADYGEEVVWAEAGKLLANVPAIRERDHYKALGWRDEDNGEMFDFENQPICKDYYFYACYEADFAYAVYFYPGSDFDEIETQYLKEGEKPFEPTGLKNKNRAIIGWTKELYGRTKYDFTQPVTEDLELFPIYDKQRLVFDDCDEIIYVPSGEKFAGTPQAEPKNEHYSFGGWSYYGYNEEEEEWGEIIFDFANTPITRDYDFEAVWDRHFAYKVTFLYRFAGSDFKKCFKEHGIASEAEVYLQEGEKPEAPPEYDNDDGERKIIGWSLKKNSGKLYDFSQALTDDIRLFPVTDKCRLRFGEKTCYVERNTVLPQEELKLIPDPEPEEHYTFLGWGANTEEVFDFTQPIKKDYTFREVWKEDFDYTVQFYFVDDFYGYEQENQIEDMLYIKSGENDEISKPPVYDNGKRKITGWKEQGSDQPFDFSAPVNRNLKLYPIYDKCRVTFSDYLHLYKWDDKSYYDVYVTPGQAVTPPAEVKDPYYAFKGWMYYDKDGEYENFDFKTPVTEDLYLETEWESNFYSIYFYNNLEEKNVPYWHGEGRVLKGQTAAGIRQQVGDPVVKGHYFAGWYYDEECTKPFNENAVLTDDIELYAKWGTNSDGSSVTPGNGNEAKVTSISLSAASLTIPKGKSQALAVTTAPLKNAAVTWSSSDNSVAAVNGGTVTAKKAGEATITATAAGGVRASCKVTVAEVKLNASSAELKTKQSSTALKIESKYPKNDTVASWKSSNPKVVKVDKKGKLTAEKKTGTAVITVTMKSGATAACKVTVKKKAVKTAKLTMNVKKLKMKKGKSASLSVTRDPITATEKITWSSSNKKVATVTSNGKVKAKKKGKATITAKSSNGKKATCKITVK